MLNKHITKVLFVAAFVLFGIGFTTDPITKAQAAEAELQQKQAQKMRYQEAKMRKELDCLARNIYFESGAEPYRGKVAVAQVTINRVNSGDYPKTVCGVVNQKTYTDNGAVCQFSWVCDNPRIRAPELYAESHRVARQVLLQGFRLPELRGAMFFHADYVRPSWSRVHKPKARIGRHIFY